MKVNDEFVLFPQCCGLLSEINDWKKILNVNFEPFYLPECHPSPKFKKVGNEVFIECDSTYEDFYPETESEIKVDYETLTLAIENVCAELEKTSQKLDKFSAEYGTESVAEHLIWKE